MSAAEADPPVKASGTFELGGELPINRLGFGSMQLTGPGVWGEPKDRAECIRVLRRAVDLGVTIIDTADSYGPAVAEDLIHEALHPYPDDLVIATKGGFTRPGPDNWQPDGRPEYLRECVESSLRRLGVDRIDLYQLHRVDPRTPAEDSLGELKNLQEAGKIRHIGASEVDVDTITSMREIVDIASVQNIYNLTDRHYDDVLDYCEREGIAFIPWFPLATGKLAGSGSPLDSIAKEHGATPSQLALAWLLRRSSVMLPIPGTSSVEHVEENCASAGVVLNDDEAAALSKLGSRMARLLNRVLH